MYPTKYVAQAWDFDGEKFKFCDLIRIYDNLNNGYTYVIEFKVWNSNEEQTLDVLKYFPEYEEALHDFALIINKEELEVL